MEHGITHQIAIQMMANEEPTTKAPDHASISLIAAAPLWREPVVTEPAYIPPTYVVKAHMVKGAYKLALGSNLYLRLILRFRIEHRMRLLKSQAASVPCTNIGGHI
jgi:hypothetical protein